MSIILLFATILFLASGIFILTRNPKDYQKNRVERWIYKGNNPKIIGSILLAVGSIMAVLSIYTIMNPGISVQTPEFGFNFY